MANQKISELTALTTADAADVLPIVDTSATQTKQITYANLKASLALDSTAISDFNEAAEDAVGNILTTTDTIALTYSDATPAIAADVITQMSITDDASGLKLDGDEATPGNTQYYGTDGAGVKGFHSIPSAPVTSVNSLTGVVVLDPDDLDDTSTTNKFVTSSDLTKLSNITVTQAVDLDALEIESGSALQSEHIDMSNAYYFTSTSSDQGGGRLEMITEVPAGGGFGISNSSVTDASVLADFASVDGYPNKTFIPSGVMIFSIQARQTAGTKVSKLYAEFYSRTNPGGVNTTLGITPVSSALTGSNTELRAEIPTSVINGLLATDRLCVKIFAEVSGAGTDPDITIDIQGGTFSRIAIPGFQDAITSWGSITGTLSDQTDLQTELNDKQDLLDGALGNNSVIGTNGSGDVINIANMSVNSIGGINHNSTIQPNNVPNFVTFNQNEVFVSPLQNSPDDGLNVYQNNVYLDHNDSGFDFGNNGTAVNVFANRVEHSGESDTGNILFINNELAIGNGTDPISVDGITYVNNVGSVNANVTINGSLQGYGFSPTVNAAASFDNSVGYVGAFYDNAIINCSSSYYTSFSANPTLANISNNKNYTAINLNPTITAFTGNAGVNGIGVSGNLGTMGANSNFNGIIINPTIASARSAFGISVNMNDVTPYAGLFSSVTVQDLTLTFNAVGNNNSYTLAYTTGATAGAEVVSIAGQDISVQIEDTVSTATQIKAALDAIPNLVAAITTTISGVGSNPQTAVAATNFSGGANAGNIKAASFIGDVEIQGDLTFTGALSLGQLNAFGSLDLEDGGGQPGNVHSLISAIVGLNGVTTANADMIGINTASLITIEANSINTSGPFGLGAACLALPAVVNTNTGSSIEHVNAAVFALNLDAGSTGGTITNAQGCRAVFIPNGVTTVTNSRGFVYDAPFGGISSNAWGIWVNADVENWFKDSVKIGGTAGSSDKVSNSSVGLQVDSKAILLPRLTTTERNALTAINGMVIYNSTTDKFEGYEGGSWANLI